MYINPFLKGVCIYTFLMYGIPKSLQVFSAPYIIKNNLIKNTGKKKKIQIKTAKTTSHGLNRRTKKKVIKS